MNGVLIIRYNSNLSSNIKGLLDGHRKKQDRRKKQEASELDYALALAGHAHLVHRGELFA
jgi:hypothetical protein